MKLAEATLIGEVVGALSDMELDMGFSGVVEDADVLRAGRRAVWGVVRGGTEEVSRG
jgi:hypothetical protein